MAKDDIFWVPVGYQFGCSKKVPVEDLCMEAIENKAVVLSALIRSPPSLPINREPPRSGGQFAAGWRGVSLSEYHPGPITSEFCVLCDVFRCTSLCWKSLQRRFVGHLSRR